MFNPELRSITALGVIEDISKCPLGFTPVVRTHDAEVDADLWKDGFFGRRVTRYLCVSKTQGRPEHVVQSVQILQDKDVAPDGFISISQTMDTNQKAFQKKYIAYKLTHFRANVDSISELVILSKLRPPEDFEHIGDINGMHVCVRKVSAITRNSTPGLSYGILPMGPMVYPDLNKSLTELDLNSANGVNATSPPPVPSRFSNSVPNSPGNGGPMYPPQYPPTQYNTMKNLNTLSSLSGLEGVPMVLREDLRSVPMAGRNGHSNNALGGLRVKTSHELNQEYQYDFHMERDAIRNIIWD